MYLSHYLVYLFFKNEEITVFLWMLKKEHGHTEGEAVSILHEVMFILTPHQKAPAVLLLQSFTQLHGVGVLPVLALKSYFQDSDHLQKPAVSFPFLIYAQR